MNRIDLELEGAYERRSDVHANYTLSDTMRSALNQYLANGGTVRQCGIPDTGKIIPKFTDAGEERRERAIASFMRRLS